MSSTGKFGENLASTGIGALICKSDWNQAYKHIRQEDVKFQFIEFGGRFFAGLMLVLGAISSPVIYDDFSKVVVALACIIPGFLGKLVQQHLYSVCVVGPPHDEIIQRFDMAYHAIP